MFHLFFTKIQKIIINNYKKFKEHQKTLNEWMKKCNY